MDSTMVLQGKFSLFVLLICTSVIRLFLYPKCPVSKSLEGVTGNKSLNTSQSDNSPAKVTENIDDLTIHESFTTILPTMDCKPREIKLSPKPLSITGLVSFPGSGNTWTRHLVQQMTGIGTSSVYCDNELRSSGFPFECYHDKQMTVIVKTHIPDGFSQFRKIVLLIRNPFDAFLAYANYEKAGHTGHPSGEELREVAAKQFNTSLEWYISLTRNLVRSFKGPVHVLHYKKLKTNMVSELRKLATFLNVTVTQQDILCAVILQEGNFHRKTDKEKHMSLLRETYSLDNLEKMREAARTTEKLLKDAYNVDIQVGGEIETILFPDL